VGHPNWKGLAAFAGRLGHDMDNVLLPIRARLNALEALATTGAGRTHLRAVRKSIVALQAYSDALHALSHDECVSGPALAGNHAVHLSRWWVQMWPLLRAAVPARGRLVASFPVQTPPVNMGQLDLGLAMLSVMGAAFDPSAGGTSGSVRMAAKGVEGGLAVRINLTCTRGPGGASSGVVEDSTEESEGSLEFARTLVMRAGGSIDVRHRKTSVLITLVIPAAGSAGEPARQSNKGERTASLSISNDRRLNTVTQVLLGAGIRVRPTRREGGGNSDLWVTQPGTVALLQARRRVRSRPLSTIILLGSASKAARGPWASLGAVMVDSADDCELIRKAVGVVKEHWNRDEGNSR
jgi:hypothetical protein